ncbi:hypothetical protein ATCC90586_009281 [Pythium insidiosum]|nr:hypothetical protein ATCC90586_009281 [Pythium insidiosum]
MVATSYHSAGADSVVVSKGIGDDLIKPPPVTISTAPDDIDVVKLWPTQMRFVTGIAKGYEDDFPPELGHLVKQSDFETAINQINNTLKDYWPCFFCICCGYSLCPCTLGISLLCPNMCIKDVSLEEWTRLTAMYIVSDGVARTSLTQAEQYVRALIHRINKRPCFARVGVEWRLVRSCGRSWIEISYPTTAKPITEVLRSQA